MEVDSSGPSSRRAWLKNWQRNNSGKILPCSAKAVYRIADSECFHKQCPVTNDFLISHQELDLNDLKTRAFQVRYMNGLVVAVQKLTPVSSKHIVKSMTVHNVPYEMFSTFSRTFEDVRKVKRPSRSSAQINHVENSLDANQLLPRELERD